MYHAFTIVPRQTTSRRTRRAGASADGAGRPNSSPSPKRAGRVKTPLHSQVEAFLVAVERFALDLMYKPPPSRRARRPVMNTPPQSSGDYSDANETPQITLNHICRLCSDSAASGVIIKGAPVCDMQEFQLNLQALHIATLAAAELR
jgi:hypothetical protein